jgi:hypothetical protein
MSDEAIMIGRRRLRKSETRRKSEDCEKEMRRIPPTTTDENSLSNDNDNDDETSDTNSKDKQNEDDEESDQSCTESCLDELSNRSTIRMEGTSHCTNTTSGSNNGTIALFGSYSRTGNHFLRLALDAGYSVRAALLPSATIRVDSSGTKTKTITSSALREEYCDQQSSALKWIPSKRLDDSQAIQRAVQGADYVVCMLVDTVYADDDSKTSRRTSSGRNRSKNKQQQFGPLTNFLQILYPLMKNVPSIKVFLYQGTSLAPNVQNGTTPVLSQIIKTVAQCRSTRTTSFLQDQDDVMRIIASNHHHQQYYNYQSSEIGNMSESTPTTKNTKALTKVNITGKDDYDEEQENMSHDCNDDKPPMKPTPQLVPTRFSYIVTRPTVSIKDGPSSKKLTATKSVRDFVSKKPFKI